MSLAQLIGIGLLVALLAFIAGMVSLRFPPKPKKQEAAAAGGSGSDGGWTGFGECGGGDGGD